MRVFYKYLTLVGILCANVLSFAQSDGCSSATPLSVTANCSAPTAGTTTGATQTIPGCVGTADDDVWYSFVATATSHQIDVVGAAGFDAVVQLFSGSCATLISLNCQDGYGSGGTETIYASGLTIGNTYTIRVYDYFAGSGTGNFTICVTVGPTPPSNDFCANAITLAVNAACTYVGATSLGATQTMVGCAGTADDDVWFKFVATNSVQTITVNPASTMDPVVQLLDGACVTFNSLYCVDDGFTNGNEVISAVGLTPGTTYYIRVYDYYNGTGGDAFDICVTGTATSAPVNDEPCNAIQLPPVTAACEYLNFTTTGATASMGAPTPASCVGGSAPQQGGFSASSSDVWFAITVPSTGSIYVSPEPNFGINDAVMALYSGTCGTLTQIACSDDHNFPGGSNDLKPYIAETGLTPGSTVYLRYWGYGTSTGDFGICVSSPTNDDCANALYICDINGYSASTSAAYTPDRPGTGAGQMYGNNETSAGVNQVDGINTGGPFGGTTYDVNIENNSWIKFTASATTATLTVSIYDCWVGNFPSGGIQMEVFSGSNCDNFVSVSNFEESSTGFVLTATGLTVGQDYYLVVDGYAGDICSYTITADSGVQFPEITASANPICAGAPTTLTGPPGATSYLWSPGGQTTSSIVVNPSTTTTYTCLVGGVCDYKQTLTKTITVNQLPTMTSSASPSAICSGSSVNLTLTSDLASSYSWVATNNANVTGESTTPQSSNPINNILTNTTSTSQNVTYTVTPTSTVGTCVGNPQTVTVTVNPAPTMTSANTATICSGGTVNIPLTSNIGSSYTWIAANNANTTGESTTTQSTSTLNNTITNATSSAQNVTYTVTPTSTIGSCTGTAQTVTVTVNPAPTMTSAASQTICSGGTVNIPLTSDIASSYSWSAASNTNVTGESTTAQGTSTINDVLTNTSAGTQTVVYSVTPTSTAASCVGSTQTVTVTVNPAPTMTSANTATICSGGTVNIPLTSDIASSYSWIAADNANTTGESTTTQSTSTLSNTITNGTASPENVIYTVTPTSTAGSCLGNSQTVTVTVNPLDDATFSYTTGSTYCATGVDPIATISGLIGGTFSIDNGGTINSSDGTIDLSLSGIGAYVVTYTTNGACPNSSTVAINITTAPDATFSYSAVGFCQTGTATVSFPPGSSGGSFSSTPVGLSINPSDGTVDLANSTPGNYTVTNDIAASGGCAAATANTTITVWSLPTVNALSSSPAICDGATVTLTGDGASTYTWDNGVTDGVAFVPASTGTTTYTVTGTDANNCQNSTTIDVLVNTLPAVVANATSTSICDGASVTLTGSGASTYIWSNSVTDGTPFTPTLGAITYTVTGTDANNCTNSDQITVTVNALPNVTITSSGTSICNGDPVTLSGNGATSYTWTGGVSDGVSFNPTVTDTYTVTGTDVNNCSNTAQVTVSVTPVDDPSFSYSTTTFCASGTNPTATITGTQGGMFTISGAGIINATDGTIDLAGSGVNTYDVTYTTNGICPSSSVVTVNITTAPDATFSYSGTQTYCQVGTETPIYPPGSSGGDFSATPAGLSINASTGEIDLSLSSAGTYTVLNDIVASGGCAPASATTTVTVLPPDVDGFSYTSSAYCSSDPNQLPTIDVAGGTFSGTAGLIIDPVTGEIDIANTPFGTYDITYTTNGTCVNDSTVSVTISGQLDATITAVAGALCETDASIFLTTIDAGGTWSGNGVDPVTGEFTPSTAGPGIHTITYEITGSCGDINSIDITVNLTPNVTVVGDTICDGSAPTLVATGNGGVINWYSDAGLTNLVASDTNIYSPILPEGIYTYYVQETLNGCSGSVDSANVNVFDLSASFTATPTDGNIPLNVDFTNTSVVVDTLNDQFIWDFGNGETSTDFEPSTIYSEDGVYTALLTVINAENMCSDTFSIEISANGEMWIEIPNIFTPNGDKENDIFHVRSRNVIDVKATIFDRWGMTMYNWHGIYAGWDGRTKAGIEASEGTYYYFIEVTDYKGEIHQYNGPFNLNR